MPLEFDSHDSFASSTSTAEEFPEEVHSSIPPPFVEVECKTSGKKSRFAAGTRAEFAVSLINRKLGNGAPLALHVEAVKEGEEEEPISFGPDAVLVNYGKGWKLQTVTELDFPGTRKVEGFQRVPTQIPNAKNFDGSTSHPTTRASTPGISILDIAKIAIAFILMFLLGGIFMLALDNLPLFINSSTSFDSNLYIIIFINFTKIFNQIYVCYLSPFIPTKLAM